MTNIFKSIGKGFLYVLLFPIIIIGVVLYGVFGLIVFLFQFIKSIIYYFKGKSIDKNFKEDLQAEAILKRNRHSEEDDEDEKKDEKPLSLYPSDSIVYGSGYSSPVLDDEKPKDGAEIKEDDDD